MEAYFIYYFLASFLFYIFIVYVSELINLFTILRKVINSFARR